MLGKSSFLKIVKNDFDPETKSNSFVEYHYAKIGREKKHYVHFYEVGSISLLPLLKHFSGKKGIRLIVAICIDLFKARNMIAQTLAYLTKIKEIIKTTKGV